MGVKKKCALRARRDGIRAIVCLRVARGCDAVRSFAHQASHITAMFRIAHIVLGEDDNQPGYGDTDGAQPGYGDGADGAQSGYGNEDDMMTGYAGALKDQLKDKMNGEKIACDSSAFSSHKSFHHFCHHIALYHFFAATTLPE